MWVASRDSHGKSRPKPPRSQFKATSKPVDSQGIGTLKPPQCDLKATLMRPSCDLKATPKPGLPGGAGTFLASLRFATSGCHPRAPGSASFRDVSKPGTAANGASRSQDQFTKVAILGRGRPRPHDHLSSCSLSGDEAVPVPHMSRPYRDSPLTSPPRLPRTGGSAIQRGDD
jgi:hypothetical protein